MVNEEVLDFVDSMDISSAKKQVVKNILSGKHQKRERWGRGTRRVRTGHGKMQEVHTREGRIKAAQELVGKEYSRGLRDIYLRNEFAEKQFDSNFGRVDFSGFDLFAKKRFDYNSDYVDFGHVTTSNGFWKLAKRAACGLLLAGCIGSGDKIETKSVQRWPEMSLNLIVSDSINMTNTTPVDELVTNNVEDLEYALLLQESGSSTNEVNNYVPLLKDISTNTYNDAINTVSESTSENSTSSMDKELKELIGDKILNEETKTVVSNYTDEVSLEIPVTNMNSLINSYRKKTGMDSLENNVLEKSLTNNLPEVASELDFESIDPDTDPVFRERSSSEVFYEQFGVAPVLNRKLHEKRKLSVSLDMISRGLAGEKFDYF